MWENPPPITVENARRVQQRAQIAHPRVCSLAWSPDSRILAAGDWVDPTPPADGSDYTSPCAITLYDLDQPDRPSRRLDGHRHTVASLAFSPDGRELVSASSEVWVWDLATGTPRAQLEIPGYSMRSLAFSPDGRLLAAGGIATGGDLRPGPGVLVIWEIAAGIRLVVREYNHWVEGVLFHPEGDLLAFYTLDGTAHLWDVAQRRERATLAGTPTLETMGLHFGPQGLLLLPSDDYQSSLQRWNWEDGRHEIISPLPYNSRLPAFHPHAGLMARIDTKEYRKRDPRRDVVQLWNWAPATWATNTPLQTLDAKAIMLSALTFSPDGRVLAGADTESIRLWSVQ
jgi:dipeptidyl aminopeptidase/acylaminoacyl peptidase